MSPSLSKWIVLQDTLSDYLQPSWTTTSYYTAGSLSTFSFDFWHDIFPLLIITIKNATNLKACVEEKYKHVVETRGDHFNEIQYEQVTNWDARQKSIVAFTFTFLAELVQSWRDQKNSF